MLFLNEKLENIEEHVSEKKSALKYLRKKSIFLLNEKEESARVDSSSNEVNFNLSLMQYIAIDLLLLYKYFKILKQPFIIISRSI